MDKTFKKMLPMPLIEDKYFNNSSKTLNYSILDQYNNRKGHSIIINNNNTKNSKLNNKPNIKTSNVNMPGQYSSINDFLFKKGLKIKDENLNSTNEILSYIKNKLVNHKTTTEYCLKDINPTFFYNYKSSKKNSLGKLNINNEKFNSTNLYVDNYSYKCTCSKSKCLKLYCDCFSHNKKCSEECECKNCLNNCSNTEQILESYNRILNKNPKALSKLKQRKRCICRCKHSNCIKKYCECFQNGKGCNTKCKCVDCKNWIKNKKILKRKRQREYITHNYNDDNLYYYPERKNYRNVK